MSASGAGSVPMAVLGLILVASSHPKLHEPLQRLAGFVAGQLDTLAIVGLTLGYLWMALGRIAQLSP